MTAALRRIVATTTAAQGVPESVADLATLSKIAALLEPPPPVAGRKPTAPGREEVARVAA